jgi:hypothetical protein
MIADVCPCDDLGAIYGAAIDSRALRGAASETGDQARIDSYKDNKHAHI